MERLHSYWRMEYVKAPKEDEGFQDLFSTLHQTENDKDALILWRSSFNYLVLNKFPYNPGHLLAVPYRSAANLDDLSEEESSDLMGTITKGKQIVEKAFQPDGFNIGFNFGCAAGAGITTRLCGRRRHNHPFALPHRSTLGWGHQFHAGDRGNPRPPPGIDRNLGNPKKTLLIFYPAKTFVHRPMDGRKSIA